MSELYPTPTRLQLLRDVDAGNVIEGIGDDNTYLVVLPDPAVKVTARIEELYTAGWVELPEPSVQWCLTDAGRDVLAKASAS